jgi:hypothetical protein
VNVAALCMSLYGEYVRNIMNMDIVEKCSVSQVDLEGLVWLMRKSDMIAAVCGSTDLLCSIS